MNLVIWIIHKLFVHNNKLIVHHQKKMELLFIYTVQVSYESTEVYKL